MNCAGTAATVRLLMACGVTLGTQAARAVEAPTTLECLASYESSLTLKNQHKLVAARAQLLVCSAASCPAEVRTECVARGRGVDEALPTLLFEVEDAAGAALVAVSVKLDGQPLVERLEGGVVAVDAGAHTFTFEMAGKTSVQKELLIVEGQKDRREHVVLQDVVRDVAPVVTIAPSPRAVPAAIAPAAQAPVQVPERVSDRRRAPVYKRWWFWTSLGALAAGGVATALILSSGSEPQPMAPLFSTMTARPAAP